MAAFCVMESFIYNRVHDWSRSAANGYRPVDGIYSWPSCAFGYCSGNRRQREASVPKRFRKANKSALSILGWHQWNTEQHLGYVEHVAVHREGQAACNAIFKIRQLLACDPATLTLNTFSKFVI